MTDEQKERLAIEYYLLLKGFPGAISSASGFMGKNDSTELSRMMNPHDERRKQPFVDVIEILEAFRSFAPGLAKAFWQILVREAGESCEKDSTRKSELAELFGRIFDELKDVSTTNNSNTPLEKQRKEAFDLFQAAKDYFEKIDEMYEKQKGLR